MTIHETTLRMLRANRRMIRTRNKFKAGGASHASVLAARKEVGLASMHFEDAGFPIPQGDKGIDHLQNMGEILFPDPDLLEELATDRLRYGVSAEYITDEGEHVRLDTTRLLIKRTDRAPLWDVESGTDIDNVVPWHVDPVRLEREPYQGLAESRALAEGLSSHLAIFTAKGVHRDGTLTVLDDTCTCGTWTDPKSGPAEVTHLAICALIQHNPEVSHEPSTD